MRFAFLGADPQTLMLAQGLVAAGRDEIAWTYGTGEMYAQLRRLAPRAIAANQWEDLLAAANLDAVVVARHAEQELLLDQMRKLVQARVPLVVAHPALDSMLSAYEIEMNRTEDEPLVVPLLPWRDHPAVIAVFEQFSAGQQSPIGPAEQVYFERSLTERSRESVTSQFARDVDLLQYLFGEIRRISAHGAADVNLAYANLSVDLTAPTLNSPIRWQVRPATNDAGGKLTILGATGRLELYLPDTAEPWRLELVRDPERATLVSAPANLGEIMADRLHDTFVEKRSPEWEWSQAARALELTETIERCLKKGRTVDLYAEDYTESSTFKGTMTSLGCGLLLAGLGLMFAVMMLHTIFDLAGFQAGADVLSGWPKILLFVLCAFLALQGLLVLAKPPRQVEDGDEPAGRAQ